jgi:beta-glucanase (GH16 family)
MIVVAAFRPVARHEPIPRFLEGNNAMRIPRRTTRLVLIGATALGTVAALVAVTLPAEARDRRSHGHRRAAPSASATAPGTVSPTASASAGATGASPTATAVSPTATATATGSVPAATQPAGWKLSWSDEFAGTGGTSPDKSKWVFDTGGEPQWGNQEWQYYTSRPENVSLDGGGNLAITARKEKLAGMSGCKYGTCDITSGRITTLGKFGQQYGRLEARIKTPKGQGMWPAFWMMGNNSEQVSWPACGEIDVMETVGKTPKTVEGTAHGTGFPDSGIGGDLTVASPLGDAFHTYAIEWDATSITWYLDTTAYFTVKKSQLTGGQQWPFNQPFYLLLNLAVGGEMPGSPDASTPYPNTMLVDYVRAYTRI